MINKSQFSSFPKSPAQNLNSRGHTPQSAIQIGSDSSKSGSSKNTSGIPSQSNNQNLNNSFSHPSKSVVFDTKNGINFSNINNTNTQTQANSNQYNMNTASTPFKPLKSKNNKIQKNSVFSYSLLPQNQGFCPNQIRAQYFFANGNMPQQQQPAGPTLKSSPSFSNLPTDEQKAQFQTSGFNMQNNSNNLGGASFQNNQGGFNTSNNFNNSGMGGQGASSSGFNFNNTNSNSINSNSNNQNTGFNFNNNNQQAGFGFNNNKQQQTGFNLTGNSNSTQTTGFNQQSGGFQLGTNKQSNLGFGTPSFNTGSSNNTQAPSFSMGSNNNQSSGLNFTSNNQPSTGFNMGTNTAGLGFTSNNQQSSFNSGNNTSLGFNSFNQTKNTGFTQNTTFSMGFNNSTQNQGSSTSSSFLFPNNNMNNINTTTAFNFSNQNTMGSNTGQQQSTQYLFGYNQGVPAYQSNLPQEFKYDELMKRIVQSAEKLVHSQKFKNYYLNMNKSKQSRLYNATEYNSLNGKQIYAEKIELLGLNKGTSTHGLDRYLNYFGIIENEKPSEDYSSQREQQIADKNKEKKRQEFQSKLQRFRDETDRLYEKKLEQQKQKESKLRNMNEMDNYQKFLPICGQFALNPSLEKLMNLPPSFLRKVSNVTISGRYGKIHFKRPISLHRKVIPHCISMEQNRIQIFDKDWKNIEYELTFYNFGQYTEKQSQEDKNQLRQRIYNWVNKNQMQFLDFDENTGNLKVRFRPKYS